MHVIPYLYFEGRCEEAINCYKQVLNAEVGMIMRFKDLPEQEKSLEQFNSPERENKILHMSLRIGESVIMGSDGLANDTATFTGFYLSINCASVEQAKQVISALSDQGQIEMPLTQTFFSPGFCQLRDKFGIGWMVHVEDST